MLFAALIATGCGGEAAAKSGVPVIGITSNRDQTGLFPKILAGCNRQAAGKWRLKEIVLPNPVDQQREQIIRRLAAKDPSMSIMGLDVIWTAEFSEAGWLYDLSNRVEPVKDTYIPNALSTAYYKGKYWGIPVGTNAALLYYRTDIVKSPPKTWQDLHKQAKELHKKHPEMAGYVWQANQYEGLTVDALEVMIAAGGQVLSEDGKKALLTKDDSTLNAFKYMRGLFEDGTTPMSVSTFQEEESRQLFQQGKAIFLRNWPYVWALAQGKDSKVKGKIGVVPLPAWEGRKPAAVLGGMNYGISRFTKHPEEAWEAIQCITSTDNARKLMITRGQMSARLDLYSDPVIMKELPFVDTLLEGLKTAHPRPVSPYYNDITVALNKTVHEVVAGHMTPEEGVKRAQEAIQLAIEGKGEI